MKFYNTVYFKILLVVLFLFIALLSVMAIFFTVNRTALIEKEIEYIDIRTLDAYNRLVDNLQKSVEAVGSLPYNNYAIELAYSGKTANNYDKNVALANLRVQMEVMLGSGDLISKVSLYVPQIDTVVSRTNRNSLYATEDINYSEFNSLEAMIDSRIKLYYDDDKVSILLSDLSYNTDNEIDKFLIKIDLSSEALLELMSLQSGYEGALVTLSDGDEVLLSVGEQPVGEFFTLHFDTEYDYLPSLHLDVPYENILSEYNHIYSIFVLIFVLFILAIVGYIIYCYIVIQKPLTEIVSVITSASEGEFRCIESGDKNSEFSIIANRTNEMTARLSNLINRVYHQDVLVRRAELKQLQSQINPHFLYNNFFMLSRMIQSEDNENASLLLDHLGQYFRYITREEGDYIELQKELLHVKSYLGIQAMRFVDRIECEVQNLPMSVENIRVPRLILQPIVENIFKYGMSNADSRVYISVKSSVEDGRVTLVVSDTVSVIEPQKMQQLCERLKHPSESEQSGLFNINSRIKLMYGEQSGVGMSVNDSGGIDVSVVINVNALQEDSDV